jgi:periplasmic protein TonB
MREGLALDDCLVEGDVADRRGERRRRARSLAASVLLQSALVAALVLVPLAATGELPRIAGLTTPIYHPPRAGTPDAPPEAAGSGDAAHAGPLRHTAKRPETGILRQPVEIPKGVYEGADLPAPEIGPPGRGPVRGVAGGTGTGNELLDRILADSRAAPPVDSAPPRVSLGVEPGNLVRRVEPRYPELARLARREGDVVLRIVVGTDGAVRSLEVLSGDILFVRAAMEAVRQWRYRPTLLNGEPVEIEGQVTVQFRLSR